MKNFVCLLLTIALMLFVSCNNPKQVINDYPLQGAWETFYIKQVFPDTTIVHSDMGKNLQVHIFTKKHFAFGRQYDQNAYSAGGGEYIFDGDSLKMVSKYHWAYFLVGKSVNYKVMISGDTLTRRGFFKNDTVQVEVIDKWRRIE
jgi:hypothetical protein